MVYIEILSFAIWATAAVNMVVNWRLFKKTGAPGTALWAFSGMLIFMGMAVFALGLVGQTTAVMLGNTFLLMGFAVLWQGARRFGGLPFSVYVACVSLVVVCVVVFSAYWFSEVKPSMVMRGAIVSAGMAVFSLGAGNTLFVCHFGSRSVTMTGATFSFYAVFNGVRMIHAVVDPEPTSIMASETFLAVYFLISLIFIVLLTLGQMFMTLEAVGEAMDKPLSIREVLFERRGIMGDKNHRRHGQPEKPVSRDACMILTDAVLLSCRRRRCAPERMGSGCHE